MNVTKIRRRKLCRSCSAVLVPAPHFPVPGTGTIHDFRAGSQALPARGFTGMVFLNSRYFKLLPSPP